MATQYYGRRHKKVIISSDKDSFVVFKWRPDNNTATGNNGYDVSWNTFLKVNDNEVAIVSFNTDGSPFYDYVLGPFEGKISSIRDYENNKVIKGISRLFSKVVIEVYFVKINEEIDLKIGTPFFDVYDSKNEIKYSVSVHGSVIFKIIDYKGFNEINGLKTFSQNAFKRRIASLIEKEIKKEVNSIKNINNVMDLKNLIENNSDTVKEIIEKRLFIDMCISLMDFSITNIEVR